MTRRTAGRSPAATTSIRPTSVCPAFSASHACRPRGATRAGDLEGDVGAGGVPYGVPEPLQRTGSRAAATATQPRPTRPRPATASTAPDSRPPAAVPGGGAGRDARRADPACTSPITPPPGRALPASVMIVPQPRSDGGPGAGTAQADGRARPPGRRVQQGCGDGGPVRGRGRRGDGRHLHRRGAWRHPQPGAWTTPSLLRDIAEFRRHEMAGPRSRCSGSSTSGSGSSTPGCPRATRCRRCRRAASPS